MRSLSLFLAVTACAPSAPLRAAEEAAAPSTHVFATVQGRDLALDLHRPAGAALAPLAVYVHGGAWRAGSRDQMPLGGLVRAGFAIASVDYRLSTEAPFPAQIHDIKAAIRYLRAHAADLHLRTDRIAIVGSSAGGHLAALAGATNGHAELEGAVGQHRGQSSAVHAIVSFYGASNLTTILGQSTPSGLNMRVPALELLFGGPAGEKGELARLASPVFHVERGDPPMLLIHGDQDPQMPVNQSLELAGACEKAGVPVRLRIVHGAAHGGREFYSAERIGEVAAFLRDALKADAP